MNQLPTRAADNAHSGAPSPTPQLGKGRASRATSAVRSAVYPLGERYLLAVLLVIVLVAFSVAPPTSAVFPTMDNFRNLAGNESVLAIVTLGLLFPLVSGHYDLSVGALAGMTTIVVASAFSSWHVPWAVGVILGVAVGATVGLINGLLVAVLEVNSLITTLGVSIVIGGLVQWWTNGETLTEGIPSALTDFGSSATFGIPGTFLALVGLALLSAYLLARTPFGRYLRAIGSNDVAARLVGLRVRTLIVGSFVVSGAFAGLAGVLLLARTGVASPQVGGSFTLDALAAIFLGATAIKPGHFNVIGTLLAIAFLAVTVTGLTMAGASDYVNDLFHGLALIAAVAVARLTIRRQATSAH